MIRAYVAVRKQNIHTCRRLGGLRGTESPCVTQPTTFFFCIYKCQINPASAPVDTNGHSNTNAASTANTPKVFHNASTARGVEPPVSPLQGTLSPVTPLASGTQVCVRAYGASAFKFSFQFSIFISSCRRLGGKWGAQPPIKLKRFNMHK